MGEAAGGWKSVVCVTGGCGFIASHVVNALVSKYPEWLIINYDALNYCSSLASVEQSRDKPNYKFIQGDICEEGRLKQIFHDEGVDRVLNFAGQSHVDHSFRSPDAFRRTNVKGAGCVLNAAVKQKVRLFMHVSTDEVYGEKLGQKGPNDESSPPEPSEQNDYAVSKWEGEQLAAKYHREEGLPVVITRCNNVYGPHQYPEKVIPKFIMRLMGGQTCCVHGSATRSRQFLYVDDSTTAFLTLMEKGLPGQVYTISSQDEKTVVEVARELVQALQPQWAEQGSGVEFVEDRVKNDTSYRTISPKLEELGWRQEVRWEDGLRRTIEWYKSQSQTHWPWGKDSACGELSDALQAHPPTPKNFH